MKYSDNGKGLDKDSFIEGGTMGITIVRTLLRQLSADYSLNGEEGFSITFSFHAKAKGSHSNL